MQDNESFANHVNNSQIKQEKTAETSLITLERSQKLDLLIHLISNLRQSLVICGPTGIGKTILLDELKTRKQEQWPIYFIDVSSKLSFESFQDQLLQFLKQSYSEYKNQDILSILSALNEKNQKIVVIMDNSGQLVPGLIDTIIQYASSHICLRMVFSLTHDELHIKNSSDRTVDGCHFIDLPPLTEKQCGVFLQNLSAKPNAIVSFEAINDRLVEKLYQNTHGIPGRIVSELPTLSNYTAVSEYQLGGAVLIAAVIALGIGYMIYDDPDSIADQDEIKTSVVLQKAEVVEISSPIVHFVNKDEINEGQIVQYSEDGKTDFGLAPSVSSTNKVGKKSTVFDHLRKTAIQKSYQPFKNLKEKAEVQTSSIEKEATEKLKKNKLDVVKSTLAYKKTKEDPATVIQGINTEKKTNIDSISKTVIDPIVAQRSIKTTKKKLEKAENKEKTAKKKITTKVAEIAEVTVKPAQAKQIIKTAKKKQDYTVNKEKSTQKRIKAKLNVFVENDDSQWILKQAGVNYTIQLMVLSKHQSAIDFLKKNQSLKGDLKYFQVSKNDKKQYAIIYGSFKSGVAASKKMKLLPAQYRKSWVRSFKILQKEIKNNQ